MLRTVVGLIILGVAATPALSQDISFEDAKADAAKRPAFLEQVFGKLVHCKEKNPAGYVKAWYCVTDTAHKDSGCHCAQCAREALMEEFKKDSREKFAEKEIKELFDSLACPAQRVRPFFRETSRIGYKKCEGILLVGDVFGLNSANEFKSTMEDYLAPYIKYHEEVLTLKDKDDFDMELNPAIPILKDIAHLCLLNLYARTLQIEKIAAKERQVSDEFRKGAIANYLDSHKVYLKMFAKEKKIWDDNNENTLQKEIVDFLEFMQGHIYEKLKKAGFEHKVVNKATFEYTLEGN